MTKCLPAVSVGRVSRTAAVAIGCLLSVPAPARAGQYSSGVNTHVELRSASVMTQSFSPVGVA